MGLFRKKKKPQYVEEILEFGEEIDLRSKRRAEKAKKIQKARQSAAAEQGGNENQGQENKKSIATEYCEQIMDAARNLEETKREYKTVTDYLTDIQIIENLPEPEFEKIQETAQNVMNLNEARDAYLNRTKTISDAQFVQMEQLEYEMPEIIKRLQENEAYQNVVKRDMQYLEGEKQEWHYYQESLEQEKKLLHRLLYALIGLFAAAVAAIVILGLSMKFDIKMPFVAAALISGALGGMMVWR